jgi:hypothetical protein
MTTIGAATNAFIFPWDAIGAPLATDAVLNGPLFTRPLRGTDSIEAVYAASAQVAGPPTLYLALEQPGQHFLVFDQKIDGRKISSAIWLRRDASGSVVEIDHTMRAFPYLPPFNEAMRNQLAGLVPETHWQLDESVNIEKPGDEKMPPRTYTENARFASPLLARPIVGRREVIKGLEEASRTYSTRRYLARFTAPALMAVVWDVAFGGQLIRSMAVLFHDENGAVDEILAFMGPFPAVAVLFHAVEERYKRWLGPEYFYVDAVKELA